VSAASMLHYRGEGQILEAPASHDHTFGARLCQLVSAWLASSAESLRKGWRDDPHSYTHRYATVMV